VTMCVEDFLMHKTENMEENIEGYR